MRKPLLLVCCLVALLAACSSSSSSSSPSSSSSTSSSPVSTPDVARPEGVSAELWDHYCQQGADLATIRKEFEANKITRQEVAARMKTAQENVAKDADQTTGDVQAAMKDVAAAIGEQQAVVVAGNPPNFDKIAVASGQLPHCD